MFLEGYKFGLHGEFIDSSKTINFYLKFEKPKRENDLLRRKLGATLYKALRKEEPKIDESQLGKYYSISDSAFKTLLAKGYISKYYYVGLEKGKHVPNFTFGLNVAVPLKYRPKLNDTISRDITPEINLGGYIGMKHRVAHHKPYYITLPIVSLGFVNLKTDSTISENVTLTDILGALPSV
jgi:hypothetical protein